MRTCLFLFSLLATHLIQAQTQHYYVRFPDDVVLGGICPLDNPDATGVPVFFNPDSLPLVAEYEDEVFGISPACFTVTRNWTVYNADNYVPGGPLSGVPNPTPKPYWLFADPENLIGPVVSPVNAPGDPWSATIIKLNSGDAAPTNFSMFWDSLANGYHYSQKIHIVDTLAPIVLNCPADTLQAIDTTSNDVLLWNAPYWAAPNVPGQDLREYPIELSVTATDSCSGSNIAADYILFLDLDQNGSQETVVRSNNNFTPGTVNFDNANTPNYNGGTARLFDMRTVPVNQKYRFDVRRTFVGDHAIFAVGWNTIAQYNVFHTLELPPGTHKIRWTITDGCGSTSSCESVLTITPDEIAPGGFQNVFIRFPDDVYTSACDGTFDFGAPSFFNPDSLNVLVSFENQEVDPVPDACYIIERNWTIRNGDFYDPLLPCIQVPNPNPYASVTHPSNLPGPVIAPQGTPQPWTPSVVKIYPSAPEPTNFSTYWGGYANCYQYTQSIKITDVQAPVALDCFAVPLLVNDSSANDPQLWNAGYWLDPLSGSNDLQESPLDLSLSATDSCGGPNVHFQYLLFLDLDQDGIFESVVNSLAPPPPGMIRFDNANTPNYAGGELRQFDQRGLIAEESYVFALQSTAAGDQKTARIRWNTPAAFGIYTTPQLPPGTHKVNWIFGDDCGNQSVCERLFVVTSPTSGVNAPAESAGNRLFPPDPNPFAEHTIIRFQLFKAGMARLSVLDATGRLLYENASTFPAGEQRLLLKKEELGAASGLLICRLECFGQVLVQKMILK